MTPKPKSKLKVSPKLLAIVALLLVGGYLLYRHTSVAQADAYSGAPGPTGTQASPSSDSNGNEGSSDQGSATADLLSALGAQNAQLLAGFQQSEQAFSQAVFGQSPSSTSTYSSGSGAPSSPTDSTIPSVYANPPLPPGFGQQGGSTSYANPPLPSGFGQTTPTPVAGSHTAVPT